MGEKTISTQVKIDGDIVPDFSQDWEVAFQGEKYIMPLRLPQGAKENTSLNSTIDLTFQHWAVYQLKRWMFFTVQPVETGTAVADKYIDDVILNLGDFCNLFGQVLRHYYGDTITIDLNPNWDYKKEATPININHSYIWDVLIKLYELFAVRWSIEPNGDSSHYVIKVGYPAEELDHIFEYGFEGGLLKVERQVQSEDIRNMLLGRGGEKNIPKYYFKRSPDKEKWRSDPDWIEELANIYFTNLMGATFRSYVQGWKAAHISKYPGYAAVGESNAYAPWAYRKGYTDSKFDPVEYVKDDESIAKYGPLLGGLDNNEEIYPSIQGSGMDIAVDVEQIESDDVEEATDNDATLSNVGSARGTARNVAKSAYKTLTIRGANFTVPTGKTANFIDDVKILSVVIPGSGGGRGTHSRPQDIATSAELTSKTINIYNAVTGAKRSASGIPAGSWYYEIVAEVHNLTTDKTLNITVGTETPKLQSATLGNDSWKNTFDIWVKNIWETSKLSTETNEEYAERVWKPILGDREQNTGKVMFATGALAISEDYEFTIVDFPKLDTSKSFGGESSHWRIKLAKSDADLESTGLYVPSTQKQGKAGDKFVFIGTEMTHHYVVWAETALDDWKKDQLREKKDIKPTWVVTTDRVRLNNEGKANALIQKLRIGNSLRLADKRFIDGDYETLYLQSITYTYREPSSDDAALNPDVAIVLSNEYATTANPVATMQGEISALQRQIGSISNIEQIVRAVGDRLYLRKSGISDRSLSPTQFFSLLTSGDFRAGLIGGSGWGFFKDENGNWVLEADRVNVRQEMQVNTLVINQAEGRGGMEIDTAAFMEVTRVVETSDGYVCYFDQKNGSVANLFHVDDVAYCNSWTPENQELKFYKRRVVAVGVDNITLSKTDVNGSGIPAEKDNIIHFGNYTDKTRQYVKVRDVVGGGYERYIENLDSVNSEGVEYYFVGKQAGQSRWFVGNKDLIPYSGKGDGSYIEYINRRFNLNNVALSVNTTIGDKTLNDYFTGLIPELKQEDIEGFVNAIMGQKIEGIQNQIDGVIESFFGFGAPTLNNYPANEWTTDEARKAHERDMYTDKTEYVDDVTTPTAGQSWKWQYTSPTDYGWVKIADSDAVKALLDAAKAQDTADGKRRVFTDTPVPPYDEGDMWVNAWYPLGGGTYKYRNDILRCGTSKAKGDSFNINDWELASKYTDDTKAQEAIESIKGYEYLKEAIVNGATQAIGGLFLSSHIRLGSWDKSNPDNPVFSRVYAGMNGVWLDSKGDRSIAAWYGGDMEDPFDYNVQTGRYVPVANPDPATRYAASAFRMDGSMYLAKGNLIVQPDGFTQWGKGSSAVTISPDGKVTLGNGIQISVSGSAQGLGDSIAANTVLLNAISNLFDPYSGDRKLTWGEVTKEGLSYDSVKVNAGLWTDFFLSARGDNPNGSGSGGASELRQLDDVLLTNPASGQALVYNGSKWVNRAIATGLDETALGNYLTTHKYATQPWVTSALGNYYSKAEADARFLRQHQSLADYVTLGTAQVISGVKTFTQEVIATEKWITAKIITGETGAANNTVQSKKSHGIELGYPNRDYMNFNEFGGVFNFYRTNLAYHGSGDGVLMAQISPAGVKSTAFIKNGGTASQFLKADGSVDSNTYLTSHQSLANYYTKSEVDAKDKRLVTYYPSRPTTANVNFGNNAGLYTFLATSSMTSGKPAGDGHILHMEWDNSLSWAGQIAVPNNGDMQWRHQRGNTWQAWRTILDSSNFDSLIGSGLTAYVKKTGDTMNGLLTLRFDTQPCLKLDSVTANKEVYMYVYSGGVAKTAVGWNNPHGSYIYNSPSNRYLGIKDNGTPHFQGNTLWHAGNDGSRSGLDADLLDGFHKSDIYDNVTAKLSSLNDVLNSNGIRIYGFGFGDSASVANKPARNSDARGTIGFGGIYCPMQLSWQYLGTDLYIRTKYDGNWQGWKRIAFTTDNVASATRLLTPRTLWGQSFDGTGNVNGAMTVNYAGSETGISIYRQEGAGAFIRYYNNNQTTNYFRAGMYGAGYFGISYNSGADAIAVTTSGNVGIGTIAPTRKLHVNGTAKAVSLMSSNIRIECDNNGVLGSRTSEINNYNSHLYLQHNTNKNLVCCVGGGNVGINTSAPGYTLDVNGSLHVRTLVYFDSTARINGDLWTNSQFFFNTSGYDQQPYMSGAFGKFNLAFHRNGVWVDTVMTIMPDGAADMTGPLHVGKGIYTEGYVSARGQNPSSDARLKDVTGNVELDIRDIARAPAVFFRWKDTGGEDVGSIAQYWQALMPQLTPRTHSGMLGLQYDKAALLGVVTVSRRVLDHEERIAALEAENASLKATIENMRGNA